MRKFSITVNGQAYEVEVEEIGGAPVFAAAPVAAPAAAPVAAPAAAPKAAPKAAPAAAGEGTPFNAPMPGTIIEVKVNVGQAVKNGDVLLILEAMKMNNEIKADRDGTVTAINVSKGATVNSGDPLLSLK